MKNFLQNMLICLALALCILCAWQWYLQTLLHSQGEALQKTIFKQAEQIQGFTNSIKNMDAEIAGLSTRISELKQAAMTNEQAALEREREILRLHSSAGVMSNQIAGYKTAVDKLEALLKEDSQGIARQNDAIKQLISARDDAIKKCNDSIRERNALAVKYNDLVDRFNKLQAAAAAQAKQ